MALSVREGPCPLHREGGTFRHTRKDRSALRVRLLQSADYGTLYRMHECCFCAGPLDESLPGSLNLLILAASRVGDADAPSQELWCHGSCLAEVLPERVPFDPLLFDE